MQIFIEYIKRYEKKKFLYFLTKREDGKIIKKNFRKKKKKRGKKGIFLFWGMNLEQTKSPIKNPTRYVFQDILKVFEKKKFFFFLPKMEAVRIVKKNFVKKKKKREKKVIFFFCDNV